MTNHSLSIVSNKNRSSFTLIELLVVLALVAILSVVVILTLNPAELIKQARDSNRLSDLSTINTALNLFSADVTSGFMGTSTVVYVSIPSASPTCSGVGLPTLPSTYAYNCVTTTNLRNTDGTGWIPVNFQRISSNSPISQLPVDPINTTSTRLYYSYVAGGSWELNASIEAAKNKLGGSGDLVSKDGGSAASQYEIGNNLNLSPLETGDSSLVGYWNFEEGPNATSSDRSGYGNNGTWYGTSTAQQHYVAGKVGNYAGSFNGSGDYVNTINQFNFGRASFSFSAWIKAGIQISDWPEVFGLYAASNHPRAAIALAKNSGNLRTYVVDSDNLGATGDGPLAIDGIWHHLVLVVNNDSYLSFQDGVLVANNSFSFTGNFDFNKAAKIGVLGSYPFVGQVDEARIYSRALSASEVLALYNATK